MKYEDKISYLIDNEVITKPTTMESLVDNMFLLKSQLEAANKIIGVLGDMNKFTLETLNEERINLHMMRQVEQGARQALAEVEKIRNGGKG